MPGHGSTPTRKHIFIDEAARTPIPALPEYAATVAGRGVSLWIAVQSLSQLDAIYGTKRAETLLDNLDTQIYYRPANLRTAKFLEEHLGEKSVWAHSQTTHEGAHTSEGQSERTIPLLTAWDIQRLPDEAILAFHRDLPPFRATRMDWRAVPELARRTKLAPPPVARLPELSPLCRRESVRSSPFPECIDLDERN